MFFEPRVNFSKVIKDPSIRAYCQNLRMRRVFDFGTEEEYKRLNRDRPFFDETMKEICRYFKIPLDSPERLYLGPTENVGCCTSNPYAPENWLVYYDPEQGVRTNHFDKIPMFRGFDWSDPRKRHVAILAHELWHRKQELDGRLGYHPRGVVFENHFIPHSAQRFIAHEDMPHEVEANAAALHFMKKTEILTEPKRHLEYA